MLWYCNLITYLCNNGLLTLNAVLDAPDKIEYSLDVLGTILVVNRTLAPKCYRRFLQPSQCT